MGAQLELDVQGHRIVATSFNEDKGGTPVVFIHGITASINFWESVQAPVFREKFRWYSLSLPGHYPASFPAGFQIESFTGDMIAAVLAEAIKKLVGDKGVILAGHSTGGFAALNIAARSPKMVVGVISISGFAHGKWNGALGLLQKVARLGPLGPLLFGTTLRALVANRFVYRTAAGFYANDRKALYSYPGFEAIFEIVYRDAKKLNANSLFPFFNRLPDIDISDLLPLVSSPTLALAGACDPIVPTEQSRAIAEKVLKGELHLLEGAGHLPMFERAEKYNSVIEKWIEGIT